MANIRDLYHVGDKFKHGRTEFTVVAFFSDNGEDFFIGRKFDTRYKSFEYAHVFCLDDEGKLMKHV